MHHIRRNCPYTSALTTNSVKSWRIPQSTCPRRRLLFPPCFSLTAPWKFRLHASSPTLRRLPTSAHLGPDDMALSGRCDPGRRPCSAQDGGDSSQARKGGDDDNAPALHQQHRRGSAVEAWSQLAALVAGHRHLPPRLAALVSPSPSGDNNTTPAIPRHPHSHPHPPPSRARTLPRPTLHRPPRARRTLAPSATN